MDASDLSALLAHWPASLAPLRNLALRLLSRGASQRDDGALLIGPTRWVGPEAHALVLFPPARTEWVDQLPNATARPLPAHYAEVLRAMNGCFAFGLALFGLAPSLQADPPRLNRRALQPLDLGTANTVWVNEYRGPALSGSYIASRPYSREANVGYFSSKGGDVRGILPDGSTVAVWASMEEMLASELAAAERRASEGTPAGLW